MHLMLQYSSLVPRPSTPPVFDLLQFAILRGKAWGFLHVIHGTVYVLESRRNGIFTFTSTTETSSKEEVGPTCKTYLESKQNH